jgi:hypothetical protein
VTLAGGALHDFILLDIPFRMKSAHSPLWGNGHFYPQQNQSVNAKNAQSCRKSVKVLECLANFPSDVQALRTFFLDFSSQGLLGSLSSFNTSSGQEEVPTIAYRSNSAITVWYHSVDSSPGMIRVSLYLGTKDVLHLSHDG